MGWIEIGGYGADDFLETARMNVDNMGGKFASWVLRGL